MDKEKIIGIIDELIFEAQKEPKWKAENALRCLKKELLKEQEVVVPLTIDDAVSELMDKHYKRMKEQEAKIPSIMQDVEGIWATCPTCGNKLRAILAMEMDTYFPKYCQECGQAVKWDA